MIQKAKDALVRLNEAWVNRLAEQLVELEDALMQEAGGNANFECERFWDTLNRLRDLAMANTFLLAPQLQQAQAQTQAQQPQTQPRPTQVSKTQIVFNAFAALITAIQSGEIDHAVAITVHLLGVTKERAENCVSFLRDQMGFSHAVFAKIVCVRQSILDKDRLTAPLLEDIFGLERHEALVSAAALHNTYGGK